MLPLIDLYNKKLQEDSDMQEFMPVLRKWASTVDVITEFGVRNGYSTVSLLAGEPEILYSYDSRDCTPFLQELSLYKYNTHFIFTEGDSRQVVIDDTQMLLIDTTHTYRCLLTELQAHESKVSNYIFIHDTEIFGYRDHNYSQGIGYSADEDGKGPGLMPAVFEFLKEHSHWHIAMHSRDACGLLLLERKPIFSRMVKKVVNGIDTFYRERFSGQ